MSLVGNLEDLSLGDIMQIISMSQKSGVLALESEHGQGRIVFSAGLVQGASLKGVAGHFCDLRDLVVATGILDSAGFDLCEARAADLGLSVEELLCRETSLDVERLESLSRESVEAAVLEMFRWPNGDFSFDVRSALDDADPKLLLKVGLNAQYLAMEGMRVRDESVRDSASEKPAFDDDLSAQEMFGVVDAVLEGDLEQSLASTSETVAKPGSVAGLPVKARPLILIDPDVAVLEWVKQALREDFSHVHVFQQAEQGLMRIRQYLIRGELPVVLISPDSEVDPLSGIRGLSDFVKRLKGQAARLPIFGIVDEDRPTDTPSPKHLDAVLTRPATGILREVDSSEAESAVQSLRAALEGLLRG